MMYKTENVTLYRIEKVNYMTEEKRDYGPGYTIEDVKAITKSYKRREDWVMGNDYMVYDRKNSHWMFFVTPYETVVAVEVEEEIEEPTIEEETETTVVVEDVKTFTYSELVKVVEELSRNGYRQTEFNIVSYLIGYNKVLTPTDWENIIKLHQDGFVD